MFRLMSTAEVSVFIVNLLPKHWLSGPLARPIVPSLFELASELFPAAPNNSPRHHDVDVIGNNIIQEALIASDEQYTKIAAAQRIHSARDGLQRVDAQAAAGIV